MPPRQHGPHKIEENIFGIGRLPEQEVGNALLAAGADDKIGIGHAAGEKERLHNMLIDSIGLQFAALHGLSEALGGGGYFLTAAVTERQCERQRFIILAKLFGMGD